MIPKLRLVPFRAQHLSLIGELADSMAGMGLLHTQALYAKNLEDAGPAYTIVDIHDNVMGCGGIGLLWPGVGEAWAILGNRITEYPISLHRFAIQVRDKHTRLEHLPRVQSAIPYGHERAKRWIERLGFQYEGLMPGYGPDGSWFERYARLT